MKLVFAGASVCSLITLKRLLLIADQIAFMDRPSVTFNQGRLDRGGWGTVGSASPVRAWQEAFKNQPVTLAIVTPPEGPAENLYQDYVAADLQNVEFRRVYLDGLQRDRDFSDKFIAQESNYGTAKGAEVIEALVRNKSLLTADLSDVRLSVRPYEIGKPDSLQQTLKMELAMASIQVTSAMIVSAEEEFIPVTDDPHFSRLLSLRTSDKSYVGGTSRMTPLLGLEVTKVVLPDTLIAALDVEQLLRYREKARDAYAAWSIEMNRLASQIDDSSETDIEREVPRLIASEVAPRLVEYRREMESLRDDMFAESLKTVLKWEVPALSLAAFTHLTFAAAIAAFTGLIRGIAPPSIDYIRSRRAVKRKHSMSYLVGLTKSPP